MSEPIDHEPVYQDHDCVTGSLLGLSKTTHRLHIIPMFCHKWTCPRCRKRKTAKWREIARRGAPERFITLTVRCRPGYDPREYCAWMKKRYAKFVQDIRKQGYKFEYMLVWELTKKDTPHIHLLQRGDYIPKKVLNETWCKHTGSFITKIKQIRSPNHVYAYISKYMGKALGEASEKLNGLRIIQKSKGYIVLDPKDQRESKEREHDVIDCWIYCSATPRECVEVAEQYFAWAIDPDSDSGHLTLRGHFDEEIVEKICFMFDDDRSFQL